MTSSEIRELFKDKLIPYYENCIKGVRDCYNWQKYIDEKNIDLGICFCASHIFDVEIYKEKSINNITKILDYSYYNWFKEPDFAEDREECLELLQKRVKVMKEYVNKKKISKDMF